MELLKKVLVYIFIIIAVNLVIYAYPWSKILTVQDIEMGATGVDSVIHERIYDIVRSDVDDKFKEDALLTLGDNKVIRNEQRDNFFKVLLYDAIVMNILVLILGLVIRKKSINHKYIGNAFILSVIISTIFLMLLCYSLYLSIYSGI